MKHILIIIGLMIVSFNLSAQTASEYFTRTTAALESIKAEAIKKTDYTKAAAIQSELDVRKADEAKVIRLKEELNQAVARQDYTTAALLKEEVAKLEAKDVLRAKIEAATAKEDYTAAAQYKKELEQSYGTVAPVVASEVPAQPAAAPVQPDNRTKTKTSSSHRTMYAWSAGINAPIGIMMASLPEGKKFGIFLAYRTNLKGMVSADQRIKDGAIDRDYYIYTYSGDGYYGRVDVDFGLTSRLFGKPDKTSGYIYYGLGVSRYRYLYDFDETDPLTNTTRHAEILVVDRELSGWNLNIETGFLANFNRVNLHMGAVIGVPEVNQSMLVLGLGYTLR